jgi:hypothetical protein
MQLVALKGRALDGRGGGAATASRRHRKRCLGHAMGM